MEEYMLPCLNKQLFGVDCLGCGAQRALMLIFQGEFLEAWNRFPAIYPILILLAFATFNLFKRFKFDFNIKMGLLMVSAATIIISYFFKMSHFI